MQLVACHFKRGVGKNAGCHDVLLHQANEQHHLYIYISKRIVAGRGPEGVQRSLTDDVMLVSGTSVSCALRHLLLAVPGVNEHALMRRIVHINRLHQRINRGDPAGQQRRMPGRPKALHRR